MEGGISVLPFFFQMGWYLKPGQAPGFFLRNASPIHTLDLASFIRRPTLAEWTKTQYHSKTFTTQH